MDFNKFSDETKKCISAVIECIDDGIFITDGEGTVVELNKSALGCQSRERIIGKNMRQLIEEGIYEDSLALRVIKAVSYTHLGIRLDKLSMALLFTVTAILSLSSRIPSRTKIASSSFLVPEPCSLKIRG